MTTTEQRVHARFPGDVERHKMTVELDQGLYRSVLFKGEGSSFYWFRLITSPGLLTVTGDMGTFAFRRLEDMFEFFRSDKGRINPPYWAEKCIASSDPKRAFSRRVLVDRVKQHIEDWADGEGREHDSPEVKSATQEALDAVAFDENEREAYESLHSLEGHIFGHPEAATLRFTDTWEWTISEYELRLLWCMEAIVWGIQQWDTRSVVKRLDALAKQAEVIERVSKAARSMDSAGPTQKQLFDAIMEIRSAVDEVRPPYRASQPPLTEEDLAKLVATFKRGWGERDQHGLENRSEAGLRLVLAELGHPILKGENS